MRGVSLEEITKATRIGTRFLEALEQEAWERLPGGVFNRGFVRTVARFLGLEEETLLAEYSLAAHLPGSIPAPAPSAQQSKITALATNGKKAWIALSMAGVLVAAGAGWFGWQWVSARRAKLTAAASALPAAPRPPAAPPVTEVNPSASASPIAAIDNTGPWAVPDRGLQLRIDTDKETSITVTADGQQSFAGTILPGQSRSFNAQGALTVGAADAGSLRLELNGQPLQPMGPVGQPGKMTFSNPSSGGHD